MNPISPNGGLPLICIIASILFMNPCFTQSKNENFVQNIIDATPINSVNSSIQIFNIHHTVEIVGQNYYGIKSLHNLGVNGYYKLNDKNLLVIKSKFLLFDQLFNRKIKLGYYRKLISNVSGGFEASYIDHRLDHINNAPKYNMDLALSYIMTPKLMIAIKIKELYPADIGYFSSSMHLDLFYKINANLIGSGQLTKKLHQPLETIIGLFYIFHQSYINIYVNPQRVTLSYSLGHKYNNWLDFKIGNEFHQKLGISTKTSVAYHF